MTSDDQDVRGGHHCYDHQWVDLDPRTGSGHCGICHEREPMTAPATYKLQGRELNEKSGCITGKCIFCGKDLHHFNCHGEGWCLGALVEGKAKYYLYCKNYDCTPRMGDTIWRCGCQSDYVENVGKRCHLCKRPRASAIPVAA